MKRVIFLSNKAILPSCSASSVNVMKMSEALSHEGCVVTLISKSGRNDSTLKHGSTKELFDFYAVEPIFSIKLNKIKNRVMAYLYLVLKAYQLRPCVVYTREPIIALLTSFLKIDTIFHGHGMAQKRDRLIIQRLQHSKYIILIAVVSEGLKVVYERDYSLNTPKLQVLSNGVDLKRFIPALSRERARSAVGLPAEATIIGYSGHLYEGRGLDIILEISRSLTDYIFLIVGGNPEDLARWCVEAGPNVIFTGHVPNGKVPLYLFSSDILLMPYQQVIQIIGKMKNTGDIIRPLKLFEYMAAARPIVASDLPGLKEVLNNTNAFLVEPGNPEEWIKAIVMLMNSPQLRDSLAESARREVEKYTCGQIAKIIIRYYCSHKQR